MSVLFSFCMCTSRSAYYVENKGKSATDSLKLQCVDTIALDIGNRIRPIPSSSQILEFDSLVKYAILDENTIHVFDILNDSIIKDIDMKKCGMLNNYSGFSFINNDSIFAYNYKDKVCFMTNTKGDVISSQAIPQKIIEKVSPEALSCSPALSFEGKVIVSGAPISHSTINIKDPISAAWDYKKHKLTTGANYPEEYSKAYFGGIYLNTIYQCKTDNELITYSFPISNYIYRYDKDLEFVDSLYMGSRYTHKITSEQGDILDFLSDKDKRLNYYLEQDSYGSIFYNEKQKLYYRIAEHPLATTGSKKLRKPFSIIVMDNEGHLITETSIINKDRSLITPNAHVYKDGIIIQIESKDENIIKFAYFSLVTFKKIS